MSDTELPDTSEALPYRLYDHKPEGEIVDAEDYLGRVRWETMNSFSQPKRSHVNPRHFDDQVDSSFFSFPDLLLPDRFETSSDFANSVYDKFLKCRSSCETVELPDNVVISWKYLTSITFKPFKLPIDDIFDLFTFVDFSFHPLCFAWVFHFLTQLDPLLDAEQQSTLRSLVRKCVVYDSGEMYVQALILVIVLRKFFNVI
ncbi:hypothetical protein RCL1_005668 [Eukaryota sp. TZLM3-RCL]